MTDEKRVLTGEIVSDDMGGAGPDMQVPLQMPPGVQGMTLGQALLGQTRYWGYRRAINAYRRAVEDKVDMVRAVTNLYGAIEDLEAQKISFGLRDERHEIARLNVLTKLDGHRAARKMAEAGIPVSVVDFRIDKYSVFGGMSDLPNQAKFNEEQISIPLHEALTEEQLELIVSTIHSGW